MNRNLLTVENSVFGGDFVKQRKEHYTLFPWFQYTESFVIQNCMCFKLIKFVEQVCSARGMRGAVPRIQFMTRLVSGDQYFIVSYMIRTIYSGLAREIPLVTTSSIYI